MSCLRAMCTLLRRPLHQKHEQQKKWLKSMALIADENPKMRAAIRLSRLRVWRVWGMTHKFETARLTWESVHLAEHGTVLLSKPSVTPYARLESLNLDTR